MIRLGLCCIFKKAPIKFRVTTARKLQKLSRNKQLINLSQLCLENSRNLLSAVNFVHQNGIGAFRVSSQLFPRFTHPEVGYQLEELQDNNQILHSLGQVRDFCFNHDIRLSFHPDQFVVLSSPQPNVIINSRRELEYQGFLAELIGADVINVHGGGGYRDKKKAMQRFVKNFHTLSARVRKKLTLENDDNVYTVRDLTPVCEELGIPLVYDVHHHRCNPDGLSIFKATELALRTWGDLGREPYFHLSSPKNGWQRGSPKPHADYINPADFPDCWKDLDITVDLEGKFKELAVFELKNALRIRFRNYS